MAVFTGMNEWPRRIRQNACNRVFAGLCLLFCLLLPASPGNASPPALQLNADQTQSLRLQSRVHYLRDSSRRMSPDQVLARRADMHSAAAGRDINFGYTNDRIWLLFELVGDPDQETNWIVEMLYPSLDRVSLYQQTGSGSWEVQRSGDVLPSSERSLSHRTAAFPLQLDAGERRLVLLSGESAGSLSMDAMIWPAESFRAHSNQAHVVLAAYLGMILALGGYNLLLFFALREPSFLLYVLFIISFGMGAMAINGLGPHYLWPNAGELGNRILPTSLILASSVAALFTRSFLDVKSHAPTWYRLLSVAAATGLLLTLASLLLPVQLALQVMSVFGLGTTVLMMICGIHCIFLGAPGARIFVLAWGLMLMGAALLALRNFALIPNNFITLYSVQVGSALEMLLLSFGLAARFNELKRQKEIAQTAALNAQRQHVHALQQHERVLEQRVTERTRELEQANKRLEDMAMQDALTGLANRPALSRHLNKALARADRNHQQLALLMIDLDDFKPINDVFGHAFGDQVLKEVAERLQAAGRAGDFVARLGGDEFIVVSEGLQQRDDAHAVAERLLDALAKPIMLDGQQVQIGASIGVSHATSPELVADELIRQADQAMYARKRQGRSGISYYSMDEQG
ncbi:diguanylate cyclase [Halopseudomonas salegens]|uniref:Diguanylate cyclase (GGDEF) domain-containing protein n=1 Tax=Halopseudomonas salegens TaxID=1434072 RepID=A0A1H2DYG5_9GAMM|nr:diguanylate cyclase [Halopseudomonas salegens]SDT87799.1 diguanylate cyclase (GGDEF) domain-containing protein [Halopseudomonas salegens]